jgi:purine-nucleoside phosphorylase
MHELVPALGAAVERWRKQGLPRPDVVVVSGSGLAVDLGTPIAGPWPLQEWVPFAREGVAGHPLTITLLTPSPGRNVLYFGGRLHTYQDYDAHQVVFPVRLGAQLGARRLLMTNAAGSVHNGLRPGQLVALRDQLNMTGMNPLRGGLPADWGPQFPDMTDAHSPRLRALAHAVAARLEIDLAEGVYAGLAGPAYETMAEVAMLRTLGADLVGMSTVLEVIAARHLGVECLAISLVTNVAGVVGSGHEEVLEAGRRAAENVRRLLAALLTEPEL